MSLFDLTLTQRATVHVPPARVWEVFSDIEAWPRWNRVFLKVDRLQGQPWTVGFRFFMALRMAGVSVPFHPTIVEVEAPHRVVWTSTRLTIPGRRPLLFQPVREGTLMTDEEHFSSPVLPVRLFYPRPVIVAMSNAWLRSLKEEVERHNQPAEGRSGN